MQNEILLTRFYQDKMATLGIIILDNYYGLPIFTLEKPKDKCIDIGKYKCKFVFDNNAKHSYKIENLETSLKVGSLLAFECDSIIVGHSIIYSNYDPVITNSTAAMQALRDYTNEKDIILDIV